VVSARDFAECQVSDRWLQRRIETGEWIRLHRGVFRLGAYEPTLDELDMAAMLAAGNGAVLSHASAARRLGLEVREANRCRLQFPL